MHYLELRPDMRLIQARTGLTFIPVLLTPDDEAVQDTSEILDALETRHPSPPLYPRTPVQSIVSRIFELYADEFMILPAMHYRWSFPASERKARGDFSANIGIEHFEPNSIASNVSQKTSFPSSKSRSTAFLAKPLQSCSQCK